MTPCHRVNGYPVSNEHGQAAQELLGEDFTVHKNVRNRSPNDSHISETRILSNTAVRMSVLQCPETFLSNILSCTCQKVQYVLQSVVRQTSHTYHNIDRPSRNNCRGIKAISITYCVCVCVCSLSNPPCKAHAPYYIVSCGLSRSAIFFHIIS